MKCALYREVIPQKDIIVDELTTRMFKQELQVRTIEGWIQIITRKSMLKLRKRGTQVKLDKGKVKKKARQDDFSCGRSTISV